MKTCGEGRGEESCTREDRAPPGALAGEPGGSRTAGVSPAGRARGQPQAEEPSGAPAPQQVQKHSLPWEAG